MNPNFKYKSDIALSNTEYGANDIFEVVTSQKDKNQYIISPNKYNYNLDIFILSLNNKKILSLKGHNSDITTIRYFLNNKNNDEYLISGDLNKIVIIWDITNNYNIKYKINTKYGFNNYIFSCLLIFPINKYNNYIITSSCNISYKVEDSSSKIYSLNNGHFINNIKDTNLYSINYLISWYNKKNNKYYIIQLSDYNILINDLLENKLYYELSHKLSNRYFCGYIYNKNNIEYLCSSTQNGYIIIWNLYNKEIIKLINIGEVNIHFIIDWNNKYIIVADYFNKSIKIIDLKINKVISDIKRQHTSFIKCVKKIFHPVYGESLLSCDKDGAIKLWIIL